jgi:hypothetical protein
MVVDNRGQPGAEVAEVEGGDDGWLEVLAEGVVKAVQLVNVDSVPLGRDAVICLASVF